MPDGAASRVGVVGVGRMGRPMALAMGRAGLDVRVFDLSPAAVAAAGPIATARSCASTATGSRGRRRTSTAGWAAPPTPSTRCGTARSLGNRLANYLALDDQSFLPLSDVNHRHPPDSLHIRGLATAANL